MQGSTTDSSNNIEKINLMPMDAGVNNVAPAKHKKIGIIIAVILVTIIAIAGAVIAIILFRFNRSFTHGSPHKHSSYFIPESTDRTTKYALFDKEGNNLTGFTIKAYNSFVDGYALVRTMDGWSIIGEDGKPSVEAGEYDGITRVGGLYSVFKVETGKRFLIHGSGRIVTEFNTEQNPKLTDLTYDGKKALVVAIHRDGDKYDIYNAHGELVSQINSENAPTIGYRADYDAIENSISYVSYDSGMIILSHRDLSVIANVNTSYKYEIRDLSNDHNLFVLTRTKEKEDDSTDKNSSLYDDIAPGYPISSKKDVYSVIVYGEYYNVEDRCRSAFIANDPNDDPGFIYCAIGRSGRGFIDKSGEIHESGTGYDGKDSYYVLDSSHYASYDAEKRTVTIDNDVIGSVTHVEANGLHYVITAGGRRSIYDQNGKRLCKLPDDAERFLGFDSNDVSIVTAFQHEKTTTASGNAFTKTTYQDYLIDKDCTPVSKHYDKLRKIGDYYEVTEYDDKAERSFTAQKTALIDKTGKVRIDFDKYNSFSYAGRGLDHYIISARKSDKKIDLLNENLDVIAEVARNPVLDSEQLFYRVTTDKFIEYMTSDGTILHSIPLGNGARSEV